MASYSDEFEFKNQLKEEDLIAELVRLKFPNTKLQCNEVGMKFIILIDGIKIYDEIEQSGYCSHDENLRYNDDEYEEREEELTRNESDRATKLRAIIIEVEKLVAEKRISVDAEVKRINEAKEAARVQQDKDAKRRLYENLKSEFEK